MEKLDKVIAGLECCQSDAKCSESCPYFAGWQIDDCMDRLKDDALEVLKECRRDSKDLISRKALISRMFPYGMIDNGNYPINARAVMEAILKAK